MTAQPTRLLIAMCFAAIYLIWGSTYLAIRIGLESMPPFFLCGSRFLLPGIILYCGLRLKGVPRPSVRQWWWSVATGTVMLAGASGGLVWAEQRIPSAVACLLFTTVPLWMILIEAAVQRSFQGWRVVVGLILGLAGVTVLVSPSSRELFGVDTAGALVILGAALCWSVGSLVSRHVELPASPIMTVAIQMATGGVILTILSAASGEWRLGVPLVFVSPRSALAVGYLAFAGALVGLSAYTYLLRAVKPAAVATYAFVNPVLAVLLGWLVAHEPMGQGVVVAGVMIVAAVVLIQSASWHSTAVGRRSTESSDARQGLCRSGGPVAVGGSTAD